MLSLAQAQAAIIDRIRRCDRTEAVSVADAVGRYLAESQTALVDNPNFDNSAMDGYALAHRDLERLLFRLPVRGESACGSAPQVLASGTAMRIFTGAPLPDGADTVVMQEDVEIADGFAVFPASTRIGDQVRRRGEDFRTGQLLYDKGRRLSAVDLALLSAAGVPIVPVYPRPRALVVATGDELMSPGEPLAPGQIYESNRLATRVMLSQIGADVTDAGTVADDPAALRRLLQKSGDFDFVITSGGASVGDHDLVKQVFSEIGTIEFWKAKIKPGKPIAFGRVGDRTHFFALPGNPVSSLVTFKLFVEPAVYAWHHSQPSIVELPAVAANSFRRAPGRMEFLRARLWSDHGALHAECLRGQGSHMIGTIRHANGFIVLPEDSAGFDAGEPVRVRLWNEAF